MLHVLRAYVGISYCKTGKVYKFPSSRPCSITQLVIFFLVLLTMIIIMSMIVIVLLFVLRLVLFLGEWVAEIDIGIYPLSTSQVEGWFII